MGTPISGYLIFYGSPNSPDLTGEFFDAQTDLDLAGRKELSLYFHHGADDAIGRRRIGRAAMTQKSEGLWVSCKPIAELPERIWNSLVGMAEDGLLGLSSGAPGHLVKTEYQRRTGTFRIVQWPIIDASLTPCPAEPRCRAQVGETVKQAPASVAQLQRAYIGHLQRINELRIWVQEQYANTT